MALIVKDHLTPPEERIKQLAALGTRILLGNIRNANPELRYQSGQAILRLIREGVSANGFWHNPERGRMGLFLDVYFLVGELRDDCHIVLGEMIKAQNGRSEENAQPITDVELEYIFSRCPQFYGG